MELLVATLVSCLGIIFGLLYLIVRKNLKIIQLEGVVTQQYQRHRALKEREDRAIASLRKTLDYGVLKKLPKDKTVGDFVVQLQQCSYFTSLILETLAAHYDFTDQEKHLGILDTALEESQHKLSILTSYVAMCKQLKRKEDEEEYIQG